MSKRNTILVPILCLLSTAGVLAPSAAAADAPAPGVQVFAQFDPTNLKPGGEGTLGITLYNDGAAATGSMRIVDTLPTGVTAIPNEAQFGSTGSIVSCSGETTVTCDVTSEALPGQAWSQDSSLMIPVRVAQIPEGTLVNHVTAQAAGAIASVTRTTPVTISDTPAGFGFTGLEAWFSNPDGTLDTQAGSHPYELTVAFALNDTGEGSGEKPAGGEVRRIAVNLPPGIVGDTRAVPRCTLEQFEEETGSANANCPDDTQVGENVVTIEGGTRDYQPVYNMVPPPGAPAQFAFREDKIIILLNAGVRTGGDNGITEHTNELPQFGITYDSTTIWGVPAEATHDEARTGRECQDGGIGAKCSANIAATPLLTLPTSCGEPLKFTAEAFGTYEDENAFSSASTMMREADGEPLSGLGGCDLLGRFDPEIAISPDTTTADSPAGLTAEVRTPQEDLQSLLEPGLLASPDLKNTTVTLPEGVVINPGQATGLQACQASEEALGAEGPGTEAPATCPLASKVGEDELETPLLSNGLKGNVYVLQKDPPNLELLVTASGEGVNVKLVGQVHLNETTGQLTTTFKETPELPFTRFSLSFSGGAQAALATPTKCGIYESSIDYTPWDTPIGEDALDSSLFQISSGPDGAPCVWPMPFSPSMTAGATTDQAGGYTDFTMLLSRADEQQRIEKLQFKVPEGLLGMISKVQLCGEPQAAQGTCSPESQIGYTVATAGPGPYPFTIPQAGAPQAPIYLTGPYDGAPFGLSIAVPIIAGPFNLGTEIVRAKIEVDPHTAQITVTTTPFPKTVKGIPTDIRQIDAVIDRPEFMFNPTNCAPMSFSGTAYSNEGATAPLESHFQVGSCQSLKFQPDFKVSTSGKTSRTDGASLNVKIVYPVGNLGFNQASSQSNIKSVKVDLPKQLPSRLTTLQKACPAKTFDANPAACPAASIVGHARAITPELPVPVEGPAYFVSHAGEEFPNLIVVLQGDNVTVDLIGATFIDNKTNITSSTFKEVPDVPIQSFELNLPQGKYSALAANTSLCKVKGGLKMPTAFTGQNGAEIHESTPISVTGCAKTKPKKAKKHKKSSKGHKAKKK